jgi:hypothetical protein
VNDEPKYKRLDEKKVEKRVREILGGYARVEDICFYFDDLIDGACRRITNDLAEALLRKRSEEPVDVAPDDGPPPSSIELIEDDANCDETC